MAKRHKASVKKTAPKKKAASKGKVSPKKKPAAKKKTAPKKTPAAKPATKRKRRKATPPDPRALTVAQAAKMLNVPAAAIRGHLKAGAPAGPSKRINLVHYAAWLTVKISGTAAGDANG